MQPTLFLKKHLKFILTAAIIIVITGLSLLIGPTAIVQLVGEENVYIFTFLFGIIGGVSAFTAAGFHATLFSLALGEVNPFMLALFSAPGILLGDLVFWYAGNQGKKLFGGTLNKNLNRFSTRLQNKPPWFVPTISFVYTGLTPFPGDFLMVALALINFPLKKVIVPILLGNFVLSLIITLSAVYGLDFIKWFF